MESSRFRMRIPDKRINLLAGVDEVARPVTSAAAPWNVRRKAEPIVRLVQVLDDVLSLVQRVGPLRLRRPARHGVAQVGEIAHVERMRSCTRS